MRDGRRAMQPAAVGFLLPLVLAGCISVAPKADYERTAQIIQEQTGQPETYLPDMDDAAIRRKVTEMLGDGLTVDEAVRIALLNNPRLQAVFHDVGVSRAEVVRASLPANPSLAFSDLAPDGTGLREIATSVSQNVMDLLLIPFRRKVAEIQLEQSQLAVAQQAVEMIGEVRRACYELLGLQKAEEFTQESLALAERSAAMALRRMDAGEANRLDVNLARSDALDVKRELLTLRRDRQLAEAALARLLGLNRWDVSWKLVGGLPRPSALPGTPELLRLAVKQRLETRLAEMRISEAEKQAALEQMSIFTDISVGFESQRANAPPDLRGPTLDVVMPLWHQNQPAVAKAMLMAGREKRQYMAVLDTVVQDVQKAAAAAQADAQLIRFYEEEVLPLNRENVDATARSYEGGEHDILRLTQAQRSLIEQRRAYVNVLREYATAIADLDQAMGGRIGPQPAPAPAQRQ